MSKLLRFLLFVVGIPALLLLFTIIHEVGHTVLARWFGDPNSTFYLAKIDDQGTCLGCNITDHSKVSDTGNLWVSLGGLIFTQVSAVVLLLLSAWERPGFLLKSTLGKIGLAFAFLDVPVQVVQGLAYNLTEHAFPTGVDLMDFMLLTSKTTGLGQNSLKAGLTIVAILFLIGILTLYKHTIYKGTPGNRQANSNKNI